MIAALPIGIIVSLVIFWTVHEIKMALFWIYLWQMKDYLWGRLRDHFSTHQGRRILLDAPTDIKIAFLLSSMAFGKPLPANATFILFWFIYALQGAKAARDVFSKRLKIPAWTPKTIAIAGISIPLILLLSTIALWRYESLLLLVGVDVATPLIVTGVMFALEPIAIGARKRMVRKAARKRDKFPNLKVVGITGSYGKTSTKEYLWHILSRRFITLKTKEHRNSEVGIARTILEDLNQDHEVFVCEMGAYRRGGVRMLCNMARPHIGILTGINEQHMATFGSKQAIIDTKFELLSALPSDGTAIVNWDNYLVSHTMQNHFMTAVTKWNKKIVRVSIKEKTDVWAEDIRIDQGRLLFVAKTGDGESAEFQVNAAGKHAVQNILLAAAAAKELGMTLQEIARAAETLPQGSMRLKRGMGGATILDSSYSANPDGVASDIEYLSSFEGAKIVVMPCLIELGPASRAVHERIGKLLEKACDLAVITTRERFGDIKRGASEASHIVYANDGESIARLIAPYVNARTTILLEGRSSPAIISRILKQ